MNYLINALTSIGEKLLEIFQAIVDMIIHVVDALTTFYNLLDDFDKKIVLMINSSGTSEFVGMPIVESIGVFRYLVGDIAFYMIYLVVLTGCLLTIWKLTSLLLEAINALVEQITGTSCKSLFANLIGKIFG